MWERRRRRRKKKKGKREKKEKKKRAEDGTESEIICYCGRDGREGGGEGDGGTEARCSVVRDGSEAAI